MSFNLDTDFGYYIDYPPKDGCLTTIFKKNFQVFEIHFMYSCCIGDHSLYRHRSDSTFFLTLSIDRFKFYH